MLNAKSRIEALCHRFNGQYVEGRWGKGPYMVLTYNSFKLVFDFYTIWAGQSQATYTRMRAVFNHKTAFKFKMKKANVLSKLLRSKTMTFDDVALDGPYQIKANNKQGAHALLKQGRLNHYLAFKKFYTLEITQRTNRGLKCLPGESGIVFYTAGAIKDENEIEKIIDLYKVILDTLVAIGIGYEGQTRTQLYHKEATCN